MCAVKLFYVFVKVSDRNQFCAVRQDQPIPSMLDGVHWEYAGCADVTRIRPLGFDLDDANEAMNRAGIYYYRRAFAFLNGNLLQDAA